MRPYPRAASARRLSKHPRLAFVHVSMVRTVWGPSGVTRFTVNICACAARGAATREAASLETPENARVEEARRYIIFSETAAEIGDWNLR